MHDVSDLPVLTTRPTSAAAEVAFTALVLQVEIARLLVEKGVVGNDEMKLRIEGIAQSVEKVGVARGADLLRTITKRLDL